MPSDFIQFPWMLPSNFKELELNRFKVFVKDLFKKYLELKATTPFCVDEPVNLAQTLV